MMKGQKKGQPPKFKISDMYEDQLLKMLASGHTYYEMGEAINLEMENVESYMRQYRKKYGAINSAHLIHILHTLGKLNNG